MTISPHPDNEMTTILIVEDSPTQAQQLEEVLEHAGFAVTVATDGKDALRVLETSLPDLVISDIVMPNMDGYSLCKTIKQDERLRNIPVILVTALFDPQDVIEGLVSGANNFIIKPYDEKYLLSRIEIVLASSHIDESESIQMGLDISFAGKKHHITSSRLQILNILLSTYETAIQKNIELKEAKKQLRIINENLEETISERTRDLEKTNQVLVQEIETRKKTEIALGKKTRAYQMISHCNQILIRASEEGRLLRDICSILVQSGGYRCAWVGMADPDDSHILHPVAQSGFDDEYLVTLQLLLTKGLTENGPICTAIRTRNPIVVDNIPDQLSNGSWVVEAMAQGYSSFAAFPLITGEEVMGVLTLYADQLNSFDPDETRLIGEMTGDLAFGISSLHIRDENKRNQEELLRSEVRYRRLFEAAKDGILILNEDSGEIVDANPYILNLLGHSLQSIIGKKLWEIGLLQDKSKTEEAFAILKREEYVRYEDLPLVTKEGKKRDVEFISNIYPINGSNVIQCNIRDITERKTMEEEIRALNRNLEGKVIERTDQLTAVNQELEAEIQERKDAEKVIQEALSLLHAAIESTGNGLLVVNTARKITLYNTQFVEMWNLSDSLFHSPDDALVMNALFKQVKNSELFAATMHELYKTPNQDKSGTITLENNQTFEWCSQPQRVGDDIVGRVWSFSDISQKKTMEAAIEKSLAEKEMLLKEIHHRVKNNMQVVSSLLFMQSRKTKDKLVKEILRESQNRIKSIALVHERMYQSEDLDSIDYTGYIRKITSYLFESYLVDPNSISLSISSDIVYLPIEKAVPCSLIINEMVSNALKYAFPQEKKGTISIEFHRHSDSYVLVFRDDGIGIPEGIDLTHTGTLGLELMRGLVRQIGGTIELNRTIGTAYTITFPI